MNRYSSDAGLDGVGFEPSKGYEPRDSKVMKLIPSSSMSQLAKEPLSESNKDLLVATHTMGTLMMKRIINWCSMTHLLYPIRTPGDGNCLLHAISIVTRGYTDVGALYRSALHENMSIYSYKHAIRDRWQHHRERDNASIPDGGLHYTQEEWENEWQMLVSAANPSYQSPYRTTPGLSYEFLEEIHVFVLANSLRKPIIILGEPFVCSLKGETLEPNKFVGIYLPLLWDPYYCSPTPIVIAFQMDHFVPLLFSERRDSHKLNYAVPLETASHEPLCIHFLLPEEEPLAYNLLKKYLLLKELHPENHTSPVLVAEFPEEEFMNSDNFPDKCFSTGCCYVATHWLYDYFPVSNYELLTKGKVCIYERVPKLATKSRRQVCSQHAYMYQNETGNLSRLNDIQVRLIRPGETSWYRRHPTVYSSLYESLTGEYACKTAGCAGHCRGKELYCDQCKNNGHGYVSQGIQPMDSSSPSNYKKYENELSSGDSRPISTSRKQTKCTNPLCQLCNIPSYSKQKQNYNSPDKCFYTGCQYLANYWVYDYFQDSNSELQTKRKVCIYERIPNLAARSRRQMCNLHVSMYQNITDNWSRLDDIEVRLYKPRETSWSQKPPATYSSLLYELLTREYACETPGCGGICRGMDFYCKQCQDVKLSNSSKSQITNYANEASSLSPVHNNDHGYTSGYASRNVQPSDSTSPSYYKEPSEEFSVGGSRPILTGGNESRCVNPCCTGSNYINGLCRECYDVLIDANKKRNLSTSPR